MGNDIDHGLEAFHCPRGRSRDVQDEGIANRSRHPSREPTQRVHQPHRLGEARGLPFDREPGALGGEVSRTEPGASGGDDQSMKIEALGPEHRSYLVDAVLSGGHVLNDRPSRFQRRSQGRSTAIFSGARCDTV